MAKPTIVSFRVLQDLRTWSPRVIIPIAEEVRKRGGNINEDPDLTAQAAEDIRWIQEHQQKQRMLPMPKRQP